MYWEWLVECDLLHDLFRAPGDWIGVEIYSWVEPEIELLLPVPFPLSEHISMQDIWFPSKVSQELEIDLIMCRSLRRQLQHKQ